jgi:hypothetical protein
MSEGLQEAARSGTPTQVRAPRWTTNIHRAALAALGIAIATLAMFSFVEGVASFAIFAHRIAADPPGEDRQHAQFDPQLGWVNIPNVYIPDLWGPGVYLRTNARGFRNNQDVGARVPQGKVRVICSGDSFTLGYGVDNDHAFCQRLASLDARLEPVNMGQAGYGIDQAFLWYQRDGSVIDHDIHVFAFITDDYWRMQMSKFSGYAKPVLRLRDGALVAENVPLRESSFLSPWLVRLQAAASELRTVALIQKVQRKASSGQASMVAPDQQTRDVALRIFTSLGETNRAKNSTFVLVYLPTKWDYHYEDGTTEVMRRWLGAEAEKRGIFFVDLVEELRRVPDHQIDPMFIPGDWHYTNTGNEWIAQALRRHLLSYPAIKAKLANVAQGEAVEPVTEMPGDPERTKPSAADPGDS